MAVVVVFAAHLARRAYARHALHVEAAVIVAFTEQASSRLVLVAREDSFVKAWHVTLVIRIDCIHTRDGAVQKHIGQNEEQCLHRVSRVLIDADCKGEMLFPSDEVVVVAKDA